MPHAPAPPSDYDYRMLQRHRLSSFGRWIFLASTIVGIIVLSALLLNVIDQAFGLVAIEAQVEPASLAQDGVPVEDLSQEQLTAILQARVSKGLLRRLENDQPLAERTRLEIYELVVERVVEPTIVETWSLTDSLLHRREIEARAAQDDRQAVFPDRFDEDRYILDAGRQQAGKFLAELARDPPRPREHLDPVRDHHHLRARGRADRSGRASWCRSLARFGGRVVATDVGLQHTLNAGHGGAVTRGPAVQVEGVVP